jgi:hypothetical protein
MTKRILFSIKLFLGCVACFGQKDINSLKWAVKDLNFELKVYSDYQMDVARPNTEIVLFREMVEVLRDSISIFHGDFNNRFEDMNSDGFEDVLIYQGSGARANETYNLFLFQPDTDEYKKVAGFNKTPNVSKTDHKGLLVSMVLTAMLDYEFFYLKDNGELIDLEIRVTDEDLDGAEYEMGVIEAKKKLRKMGY